MPTERCRFAIAAYDGKIYCIGGYTLDPGPTVFRDLDVNEVYDIATDSWSTKSACPIKEWYPQAHVINGKIFVVTQYSLCMYNPVANTWKTMPNRPSDGGIEFSAVVDNKLIVAESKADQVWVYDPEINKWTQSNTRLHNYSPAVGVTSGVYAPPKIYFFGMHCAYVYNYLDDSWLTTARVPVSINSVYSATVVNDVIYAIGVINHYSNVGQSYSEYVTLQ